MSVQSRELIASLSSKAKWILGLVALITGVTAAVLIGAWPPLDARFARFDGIGVAVHRCEADVPTRSAGPALWQLHPAD